MTPTSTLPPVAAERLERLRRVLPAIEIAAHADTIARIEAWKRARNAVVLAHNYQTPEIFHGVGDLTGDSLALARAAARTDADVIVLCGVHFMAETAKLLNPTRKVLIPDPEAGCSLASSITAEDVRRLRAAHPGAPVVSYVNTSAAVKAVSDVCCTSANAVEVVESLGADEVIFVPDRYLGRWVASHTSVRLVLWEGACEVHERFTAREVEELRETHPGIRVLAHPECPEDVLAAADYVGSTAGMVAHLRASRPEEAVLITECSMSDNVAAELPEVRLVRPCNLCPHMKRITLDKIERSLATMEHAIEIPESLAEPARRAVARMIEIDARSAR
jgi:quinolinate synthase